MSPDTEMKIEVVFYCLIIAAAAFVLGMLVGVSWYDRTYRPEVQQYLEKCWANPPCVPPDRCWTQVK